jgi:uncharacterized membrane protein YgaE (UPF0421/DUF939 family)
MSRQHLSTDGAGLLVSEDDAICLQKCLSVLFYEARETQNVTSDCSDHHMVKDESSLTHLQ